MADYRNDDDRTLPGAPGMNLTPEKDPEHLIPEHTHAAPLGTIGAQVTPDDPDAVRDEIERTRQRMSGTIDQIEGALLRKKAEVQERLDFAAPVRQRPWAFAAGVFGTGLALGFLTGGGKGDDDEDHVKVPRALLAGMGLESGGDTVSGTDVGNGRGGRAWENRSRELLQVVARQEEEIRDLRAALYGGDDYDVDALGEAELDAPESLGEVDVQEEWDEDWNFDDEGDDFQDFEALGEEDEGGGFHVGKPLAGVIAAGVAGIVGGLAKKLLDNRAGGMDVEVELEPPHGASVVDDRAQRYTASGVADAHEAMAPPPHAGYRPADEMDVEVELEREPRSAYTGRPPQYGRPMEVEVDLESPAPRGYGRRPRRLHAPEMNPIAGAVAVGAAVAISGLVARLLHNRRGEMDVEVELEERPAYRPSAQPRAAYTAQRDYAATSTGGELEVEVDLEPRATAGYTEGGGARGMEVEVDLEPRAVGQQYGQPASSQGDDPDGGRGRDPQSPPLM